MSTRASATVSDEMRQAWDKASVRPLWENPLAHNARAGGPPAHLWAWSELEPLVKAAMAMTSMSVIERRVLTLVDPAAEGHAAGTATA
jgi:gentisate 1,2-dioxygenase